MPKTKKTIYIYLREIFYVLGPLILFFYLMEAIKPGMVIAYLNINYLLLIWFLIATILVLNNEK